MRSNAVLAAAIVAGIAVLCALGTWQVKRLIWKQQLLATIDQRIASAPKPLAEIIAIAKGGGDIEYMPVSVSGRFLHDREQHFFATHKGATGWYIYTPLQLEDGPGVVFVNRGFVPYKLKEPANRPRSQPEGEVNITGLARSAPSQKPSFAVPNNDLEKNIFYWKDLSNMSAQAGFKMESTVVGLFIDADDTPNAGGLPVGGVTHIRLPNNHLQYAITWFGLAGALALVGGFFLISRLRSRQNNPADER